MRRNLLRSGGLLLGLALLPCAVYSSDIPSRASLAELTAIGQVIVTMSAGTAGNEAALREVIERRLENAGIALDPSVSTQLVANVDVRRDSSLSGLRHFAYVISLSFQEAVRTERVPRTTFRGTTWSGSATVARFEMAVPFEMVLDQLENKMNTFLAAVARDTKSAGAHPAGR